MVLKRAYSGLSFQQVGERDESLMESFPEDWQSALVSTLFALSAVFHEPFGLMRMACNAMKSELSLIMEVAF